MKEFDQYPKSVKKAIRYILQDSKKEQLEVIRKQIIQAIEQRYITFK